MNHIMNSERSYHSQIRQAQTEQTRARILDGLVATMAEGIAEVSIPAVARAAGVSVPTVYRYFPTRRDLIAALGPHLAQKAGVVSQAQQPPQSVDELLQGVRAMHRALAGQDDALRAAAASQLGATLRKELIPARLAMIDAALTPAVPGLSDAERERLRNAVTLLASSALVQACADYLDLSGDRAADLVEWMIRALIAASAEAPESTSEAQSG